MKGLYGLAEADYKFAKMNFEYLKTTSDDMFVNMIAYHIQQAVEKLLKYLIEVKGKRYPKTHDITELIDACEPLNITIPEEIINNDVLITKWCTQTRYNINFKASIRKIELLLPVVEEWLKAEEPQQVEIEEGYVVE
ncbi:MAG: HEPN domain-containing protein [Cellulosilyticaceae bacterium]